MKLFIFVLTMTLSFTSIASSGNGWRNITQVELSDSKHLIIKFDGSSHTESSAVSHLKTQLIVDKNHSQLNMYYTMAMAAVMLGKQVYAWVNGCIDSYNSGSKRAKITKLVIK